MRIASLIFLVCFMSEQQQSFAQSRHVVERTNCSGCRIQIEGLVSIGGWAESAYSPTRSSVVSKVRGGYLIGPTDVPAEVALFDSTGHLVRTYGKSGTGPRELRFVHSHFAAFSDSVLIVDRGNGRIQLLTPQLTFARLLPLFGPTGDMVALADGRFAAAIRTADGHNVHLLHGSGQLDRPVGDPSSDNTSGIQRGREIAIDAGGRIYAAHRTSYEIEVYDASGAPLYTLVRSVSWFRSDMWRDDESEKPWIQDITIDSQGYLWVLLNVPQSNAKPGPRAVIDERGHPTPRTDAETAEVRDMVIEVIDPVSQKVIGAGKTDRRFKGFLPSGEAYSLTTNEDGVGVVTIWRVRLPPSGR